MGDNDRRVYRDENGRLYVTDEDGNKLYVGNRIPRSIIVATISAIATVTAALIGAIPLGSAGEPLACSINSSAIQGIYACNSVISIVPTSSQTFGIELTQTSLASTQDALSLTLRASSASATVDIASTQTALPNTAIPSSSPTSTPIYTPTSQAVGLPFGDDFSDNRNGWLLNADTSGAASLANGKLYVTGNPKNSLPFEVEIPGVTANQFYAEADATTSPYNTESRICDSAQYVGFALGDPNIEQYIFTVGLQWTTEFGLTNECFDRKWFAKIFRVVDGDVKFYQVAGGIDFISTVLQYRELSQNEVWGSGESFQIGFERDSNNLVSLYVNNRRLISQTIEPSITDNSIRIVAWAPIVFRDTGRNTTTSVYFDNLSIQVSKLE